VVRPVFTWTDGSGDTVGERDRSPSSAGVHATARTSAVPIAVIDLIVVS
jgi:hypothetical protein